MSGDEYTKGYTDALTGAGWLASVDPGALTAAGVAEEGWEPLSIREHRKEYERRIAEKVWAEGYGSGVHDERMAAEHNAGSPFGGASPARINPYENKEGTA